MVFPRVCIIRVPLVLTSHSSTTCATLHYRLAASINKTRLSIYITHHGPLPGSRKLLQRSTVHWLRTANTNSRHVTRFWATDTHVHTSHLRNHTLTPWSRILMTNVVTLLVKKYGAQYRIRRFITPLRTSRKWPLFWAILNQSTLSHAINLSTILTLPTHPNYAFEYPPQPFLQSNFCSKCTPHETLPSQIFWSIPSLSFPSSRYSF